MVVSFFFLPSTCSGEIYTEANKLVHSEGPEKQKVKAQELKLLETFEGNGNFKKSVEC